MWGVVAVLLLVLWVRSFWRAEIVSRLTNNSILTVGSNHGILYFVYDAPSRHERPPSWSYIRIEVSVPATLFEWKSFSNLVTGKIPHILPAMLCVGGAVAAWWPFRWSLRTLLIATTLIAVVLGAVVYATQR
jgi:hypothetical protein